MAFCFTWMFAESRSISDITRFESASKAADVPVRLNRMLQDLIDVEGTVVSSDGEVLPGVTIIVKGTTNGVVTNNDGYFKMRAPGNAILEVSYLGFAKREINVGGMTKIDITLEPEAIDLAEVVVVGYGTIQKSDFTGASSTATLKDVNDNKVVSLPEALQGRVAGVQEDGDRPGLTTSGENYSHFYGHFNGAIDYFTHEREGELDWHNDFDVSYEKGYTTDLITDEAVRNIKSYHQESPFFIYVAYNAPHGPLQAKTEDMISYGYDTAKPSFANRNKEEREGKTGRGNTQEQTYAAMVTNMDHNIGRILQTLNELNIDENTIVLFHSDNGPAPGIQGSGSGGLRGAKFTEWEGGVRVPAIISWPRVFKEPKVINHVMGYVDIMPTLLDIAGVKEKPRNPLDGISLLPILTGTDTETDRVFYLGSGSIVSDEWKLVTASEKNPKMQLLADHLFHIAQDPQEKHNVAIQHPDVLLRLKTELEGYDNIKSDIVVPPYGEGRKGFKAPSQWTIDK